MTIPTIGDVWVNCPDPDLTGSDIVDTVCDNWFIPRRRDSRLR